MSDEVSDKLCSLLASMSSIYDEHEDEDGLKDLFCVMKITLAIVDSVVHEKGESYIKDLPNTWSQFIPIIEKIVSASESNKHLRQQFEALLRNNTDALCALLTFATRNDQQWVCRLKEFTNFELRYRFSRFFFPAFSGHELEIDVYRSNILEESFREIMNKKPVLFLGGISIFFKDEEAVGEGVLRQWLCLVCDELLDPKRNLFILTPLDNRRISPNPLSAATESHLDYFRFAGRIVGLSLKHNIQVGLLFDPIFFKVLSGTAVFWEDLRETDYETYMSYKKLLELDPDEFDDNKGYGLVFSVDVTEKKSGEVRSQPLIEDGENVVVTSSNRESFLRLKFQHKYLTLVRDQTVSFSKGFEDILSEGTSSLFFSSLLLTDLDSMLRGSAEEKICPDQWRAHTIYDGFDENDDVIIWFWQTVNEMDNEQRLSLLYFWTAVRYLPRDGFRSLPETLTIHKTTKAPDALPKSSTCLCRLTLPIYPTYETTKHKVFYVVDKDVSSSFGRI